jgi:hypothetical protein
MTRKQKRRCKAKAKVHQQNGGAQVAKRNPRLGSGIQIEAGHVEVETETLCGEATCSDECWQGWEYCPYCGKEFVK